MTASEALAKLDSSNVMAIRGTTQVKGFHPRRETITKAEIAEYGLMITPPFLADNAKWEVAYVCENCSGNGIWCKPLRWTPRGYPRVDGDTFTCPECGGEKMIWSDK